MRCNRNWDEYERHGLTAACNAADRRADRQNVIDAERSGESQPSVLIKLAAELRQLDKAIADQHCRVRTRPGVAKSERHQRAVNARWCRKQEACPSVDRMVYDASRAVVEHNAIKKGSSTPAWPAPGLPLVPAHAHPRRGVHLGGQLDQGSRFLLLRRGAGRTRSPARPSGPL
jgi:hypothetical protein